MADETATDPLIRTKLHRPPVYRNHIQRPHLLERLEKNRQKPLTLVSAPVGYGKSTLVSDWLDSCDSPSAWLSLDKQDNDLGKFLSYLLAAVETIFPHAVNKTMTLVNSLTLPPLSTLAGTLVNELDRIEQSFILVLDDYHLIKETAVHNLIAETLKHPPQSFHLVIIGRRDPALPISTLRAQSKLAEIRTPDLRFSVAETETFLNQAMGIQIDPSTVVAVEEKTEGWVTGLRLAALSMRHMGKLDPRLLEPQVNAKYVMEYLFDEVFSRQPPGVNQYLLGTAILDRFCGPLCEIVCLPGVDPFTCELKGRDFIDWLEKENLFLIYLDSENRWFRYHHLFKKLLLNQLKRKFSVEEINVLHTQASAWFADKGLTEEALQHALAAGEVEKAGSLVARAGNQMMNNEQWPRLERCLHMLPQDIIERDPALLVLECWLHHVRQNLSGMVSCLKMIEAFNATAPQGTWVNVKHVQGHFEAQRGFIHYMDAEGQSALASSQRALRDIPLHHKRARLFADIYQLGAYQMTGNLETGLSIYQNSMRRYTERDRIYHAAYLGNLGLVYWMDANLIALQQTAECLLDAVKEHPQHPTVSYGLYFLGIILYHRNELHNAEEKLAKVVKFYYAASPMNFAHSAFALALTYQAQKKAGRAREICNSVVVNSLESNNEDMLRIARAFEADLALRQGRLAEAFQWAKKYQAKPFRLTYRFYMPQITLIRILLAQGTTDSLKQAADFADQLHDFLVSIHNNRFQIDVLALKALLYDSRGEGSASLESLAKALQLSEPGGFIRLFVDLGPQMADLLKQLVKQNVAVNYIGQILAAFKEDAHKTVLDASDPNGPSPHHPLSPSSSNSAFRIPNSDFHTAQPLVQPLTNRELQILNLLGRWLQNKEIAAELFISPLTVKKHLDNIFRKLNISGRRQAVEKAQRLGILPPHEG
jgi:LuxR family maltose regulon positive regulatory protein